MTTRGSTQPIFDGLVPAGVLVRWSDDDADPPAAVRAKVAEEIERRARLRRLT